MKKSWVPFIFFVFVLAAANCQSQDSVRVVYREGKTQSLHFPQWTLDSFMWSPNVTREIMWEKYRHELPYSGGRLHGVMKIYYASDTLYMEIPFVQGKRHGTEKQYNRDGTLNYEAAYSWDTFYEARKYYRNGQLEEEWYYKGQLPHGEVKMYYPSGKLYGVIPYENGKLHGILVAYAENGVTLRVSVHVEGDVVSTEKYYYPDGTLKAETPYRNGVFHGTHKEYSESGRVVETHRYENGKLLEWRKGNKRIYPSEDEQE